MKFSLDDNLPLHRITAYGPGWLRVGERTLRESLLLSADALQTQWPVERVGELTRDHLEALAARAPELILIGTGACLEFPDPTLTAPIIARGIGIEVMTTAAAARTYNLLAGDGRKVVAALIVSPAAGQRTA